MKKKPLVDLSIIEKNKRGHCRPAMLRRAVFQAIGVHDRHDSALFEAMREAGVRKLPLTNSESLFANAHKNRDWAEAIADLLGTSVYALWPNQFVRIKVTPRGLAPVRKAPKKNSGEKRDTILLSRKALAMLRKQSDAMGGYFEVSKASGVPLGTFQKLMRGGTDPRFSTIAIVAATLGISLDELADASGLFGVRK
jgi:DNA-binding phage protein